jgi:CMP-N-acetylneuraminic acid synthetase
MKPICIIAARGGSKGVPNKNIRLLGKKPLIAHTIESAIKSKLFSSVIVSTENKKITNIAKKYGATVPFYRPKKLATDNASMDDVLLDVIKKLKLLEYEFEVVVNRDCTAPFIQNSDIKASINLLDRKKCDAVVAGYNTHLNPYFNMMEKNASGYLEFSKKSKKRIESRQNAPVVYQLTGLQTFNVKQFLKYKRIYMPKILPFEVLPETGLMIDTEFEFQVANQIIKKQIKI